MYLNRSTGEVRKIYNNYNIENPTASAQGPVASPHPRGGAGGGEVTQPRHNKKRSLTMTQLVSLKATMRPHAATDSRFVTMLKTCDQFVKTCKGF